MKPLFTRSGKVIKMNLRTFLSVSTALVLGMFATGCSSDTQQDDKVIRLPVGQYVEVRNLSASADGKLFAYEAINKYATPRVDEFWALEPESGKTINLSTLIESQTEYKSMVIPEMRISYDGTKIAVLYKKKMGDKTMVVLVVDINSRKVTEVTEAPHVNMWV